MPGGGFYAIGSGEAVEKVIEAAVLLHDDDDVLDLAAAGDRAGYDAGETSYAPGFRDSSSSTTRWPPQPTLAVRPAESARLETTCAIRVDRGIRGRPREEVAAVVLFVQQLDWYERARLLSEVERVGEVVGARVGRSEARQSERVLGKLQQAADSYWTCEM